MYLQAEVRQLQTSIKRPSENLVIRPRSSVVHLGMSDEVQNEPRLWRTKCGWQYGLSRFFRVAVLSETQRQCRKCFSTNVIDTQDSSEDLESSSTSSSSQSSEPSSWPRRTKQRPSSNDIVSHCFHVISPGSQKSMMNCSSPKLLTEHGQHQLWHVYSV